MELERVGGNCIVLTTKKAKVVIDPAIVNLKLKPQADQTIIELLTQPSFGTQLADEMLVLDCPGEYEILDVSITGIPARTYLDPKTDPMRATMYKIEASGVSMVITGHINPELSDTQLEAIGVVDIVILPVGGNGYTLDTAGAIQIVKAIDPKVVIPTHYAEPGVAYPIPQVSLDNFIKELGAPKEETSKLKLKGGMFGEALTVYKIKQSNR